MTEDLNSTGAGHAPAPDRRYIALLVATAAVMLSVGALLRPDAAKSPIVQTTELATLPERTQRRTLRDVSDYVGDRATSAAASITYLPEFGSSAIVLAPDSALTAFADASGAGGNAGASVEFAVASMRARDSAATATRRASADTLPGAAAWGIVVARTPDGGRLSVAGLTGGLIPLRCGEVVAQEYVFDAVVPLAFQGGAMFDLDGAATALAVPCDGRIALVPLAAVMEVVRRRATADGVLWARYGMRLVAPDSLMQALVGRDSGVVVAEVVVGGAAEAAGLRPGDIVTHVGGRRVATLVELFALLPRGSEAESLAVLRSDTRGATLVFVPADSRGSPRQVKLQSGAGTRPILRTVPQDSRAWRAGLRAGDRVVGIGSNRAPGPDAVARALTETSATLVTYERDGRQRLVVVR